MLKFTHQFSDAIVIIPRHVPGGMRTSVDVPPTRDWLMNVCRSWTLC
jgi:hypothetical protein